MFPSGDPRPWQRPYTTSAQKYSVGSRESNGPSHSGDGFLSSDSAEQLSKTDIGSLRFIGLVIPKLEDWGSVWPLTLPLTFRRAEKRIPF